MTCHAPRLHLLTILTLFALSPQMCSAGLLFSEDFEAGHLNQWTPKADGVHSGENVLDPLDAANRVVHFTQRISRGDIFSLPVTISNPNQIFSLEFDYLGITASGEAPAGGFLGLARQLDTSSSAAPDSHKWLASTSDVPGRTLLVDDATWHHYEIDISDTVRDWFDLYGGTTGSIDLYVILEDFDISELVVEGTAGPGDAYFDNITVTSSPLVVSAVPEPSSFALLLTASFAFGGMQILRRKSHGKLFG